MYTNACIYSFVCLGRVINPASRECNYVTIMRAFAYVLDTDASCLGAVPMWWRFSIAWSSKDGSVTLFKIWEHPTETPDPTCARTVAVLRDHRVAFAAVATSDVARRVVTLVGENKARIVSDRGGHAVLYFYSMELPQDIMGELLFVDDAPSATLVDGCGYCRHRSMVALSCAALLGVGLCGIALTQFLRKSKTIQGFNHVCVSLRRRLLHRCLHMRVDPRCP